METDREFIEPDFDEEEDLRDRVGGGPAHDLQSPTTLVNFEDGMAVAEVDYGDGSMPPHLHLGLTNIDPQGPNGVKIALNHDEVLTFAHWLIQRARTM